MQLVEEHARLIFTLYSGDLPGIKSQSIWTIGGMCVGQIPPHQQAEQRVCTHFGCANQSPKQ